MDALLPTTLKTHKDKFEPRATPHVFLEYPFGVKGYKVLDLATKRLHVSRDVQFYEHIFPFSLSCKHSSFPSISILSENNIDTNQALHIDHVTDTEVPVVQTSNSPVEQRNDTLTDVAPFTIPCTDDVPSQPIVAHRRSSRSHTLLAYLQDYNYILPNLQSTPKLSSDTPTTSLIAGISFPSLFHHDYITSFSLNSQQLMKTI